MHQTGRTLRRRNARNFEERVFQEYGDGGRGGRDPVGRTGVARQSAGHANRMPDLSRPEYDRQGLYRHHQAACRDRFSDDRTVLAGGLRRLRLRRSRQIQRGRAAQNVRRFGGQVRELALRHRGVAEGKFVSPPPETAAVLVTLAGALVATFTLRVMGGKPAPAARASECVQVSVARFVVQPAPLIAVAVRPAGNVSTTLTVPLDAAALTLVTVTV